MKNKIEHIKAFIHKHKTLFIVLGVIKFLVKIAIVLFMVTKAKSAAAQTANQFLREGNKLYKNQKYNNATESYAKALQLAPKDVRAYFNQGDAFYRLNELDKSKDMFDAVSKAALNSDIKARAFYNTGNIFYKQEKYEESAKAYKESLKLNPKDVDVKYNLMMALAKIKKNKNNENKNNKDNKNNKENKDNKNDKNQQNQNKNNQNKNNQNQQGAQNQQTPPGQMSKEQVEKLLEAMSAEEGKVQQKLSKEKGETKKAKVQKDW